MRCSGSRAAPATAAFHDGRLRWLGVLDEVRIVDGDLTDLSSVVRLMQQVRPDEVYNLGAQSFVGTSWHQPILTGHVTAMGVTNMLEAVRLARPDARFYQASSSEMYGLVQEAHQSETTPFYPRSPLRRGQALRTLDHGELPREPRHARELGHPVQPREPAARHRVRDAKGHRRGGAHQARDAAAAQARQHRSQARLGPRARLREGHVG